MGEELTRGQLEVGIVVVGEPLWDSLLGLCPRDTDARGDEVLPPRGHQRALLLRTEEVVHQLQLCSLPEAVAELHEGIDRTGVSESIARREVDTIRPYRRARLLIEPIDEVAQAPHLPVELLGEAVARGLLRASEVVVIGVAELGLPPDGTLLTALLGDDIDDPAIGSVTEDSGSSLDDLDTLHRCGVYRPEVSARSTKGGRLGDPVDEHEDTTSTQGVVALIHIVPRRRDSWDEVPDDRLHVGQDLAHLSDVSCRDDGDAGS